MRTPFLRLSMLFSYNKYRNPLDFQAWYASLIDVEQNVLGYNVKIGFDFFVVRRMYSWPGFGDDVDPEARRGGDLMHCCLDSSKAPTL